MFYLVAAALLVAAGICWWRRISSAAYWGTILAVIAETAAWFIYFRLLGRLAWYCTDLRQEEGRIGGRLTTTAKISYTCGRPKGAFP